MAHGAVGGLQSAIMGGDAMSGAFGAGMAQGLAPVIDGFGSSIERIGAAGLAGGITAVALGGDLKSGVLGGAFGRAFNDEMHMADRILNVVDDVSTVVMTMGTAAIASPIPGDEVALLGVGGSLKLATRTAQGIRAGRTLTSKQAVQAARGGKDIIAGSHSQARQVARNAFKRVVRDPAHRVAGPGARPHYHDAARQSGSHIFY